MRNIKYLYMIILGASLTVTGCSLFESQEGGEMESASSSSGVSGNSDYDSMLADVTSKLKALDKEGGVWAYTEETLDKAAEAAKNKEFDKAVKLLKEAEAEVAIAKDQHEKQKNAGPYLF